MCGIVGKFYFDPERQVTARELQRMASTLVHRGPDGEGVWADGNVGLAHRRLAIIDLRDIAGQPMCSEDGSVWIIFNGEIYNFHELRRDLEVRGYRFRTNSDTEVIVHAYEEYGRGCLDLLRGMFAFAIWDVRKRTLFLARDRVGKKPLYYYRGADRFVFGSEIKAILADPEVPREPDPIALDHFLALQYIPSPMSAFRGIAKLPAAHWLELRDRHIETGRYWQLRYTPKRMISWQDAIAELQHRLAEAVRLRLVSDVPLGAFLSGGVDSSAVVTYMAQAMGQPVHTFSVGFEEAAFDERPYARLVAEGLGTNHTELLVKAPVTDILPRLVWHYDEPFGDASALPSYAIAALTRQHVTVALNGDGGDENFAGYDWYVMDKLVQRGEVVPRQVWQYIAMLTRQMPQSWTQRGLGRRAWRLAEVLALTPVRRYVQWVEHLGPEARRNLYTEAFSDLTAASDPDALFETAMVESQARDRTDAALYTDVNLYLQDDLLVKMDRASMAHSLEARSPFLDHHLMEFVASLPSHYKLRGRHKKHLLKAALRGIVPDEVLDRPKMGFCIPLARWFREDLRDMTYDLLLSSRARQRGYFQSRAVSALLDTHCTGQRDHATSLWDLLIFELWHRTFIDHDSHIPIQA